MTDETKTAEATKTVDDIKSRMVFDSPAAALSYIGGISDYEGFGDLQQAIVGLLVDDDGNPVVDDEGNPQLDPAIYDSTMQVAVAVLSEKDTGAKKLRSEEHTSELQSLMRISYAVFCLKKKKEYYSY